jgi:hypothetical protein
VQDAARDHHVVAGAVGKLAERRLEHTVALDHEHDFVALRVAVEDRVVLARAHELQRDVVVEEQGHAIAHRARAGRELLRPEVPMAQQPLWLGKPLEARDRLDALDRGRQVQVIEQRARPRETLVADQLLVVDAALLLAEGDVALPRDAPQLVVDRHGRAYL